MNHESSLPHDPSDHTMIFGMKVKVEPNQGRAKTYLSIGLLCMILALCFHLIGVLFQGEMVSHSGRHNVSPEVQAWVRTCSSLSFVCLWLAIMTLFQVAFQHRKRLQSIG